MSSEYCQMRCDFHTRSLISSDMQQAARHVLLVQVAIMLESQFLSLASNRAVNHVNRRLTTFSAAPPAATKQ